ncbi:MAG TPA: hypothetical protein VE083_00870 [Terriglobales bacterium]|nr:hypothetical protein [Terriglobales bacterium]
MAMHESGFVRGNLYFENAHVFVLKHEMMMRLAGNFDFSCCLGTEENRGEDEGAHNPAGFHRAEF